MIINGDGRQLVEAILWWKIKCNSNWFYFVIFI